MEELQELVRIVAKEGLNKVDDLRDVASDRNGVSKISRFYQAILKRKIETDTQAASVIELEEGSVAYRSIKSRLKRKIYNSLYLLDLTGPGTSDYYKASFECSRGQHFVRVLTWLGSRKAATQLSGKMLSISERFELAEFAVFFLRSLVQKASDMERKHDFNKYAARLEFWWQRWLAEESAILAYYKLQIAYAHTVARQLKAGREALKTATIIEENLAAQDSFMLRLHLYRLKGHGHYVSGHFQKSIDTWTELDQYYNEHPIFDADVRRGEIALHQMPNYLHLKDDKQAYACATRCFHYFSKGSINKMVFYEPFILLLMHKGRYKDAAINFYHTNLEIPWKEINDFQAGRWKLIQAYLYYASPEDYKTYISESFKFSKTINEIRTVAGDKKGLNISLLILETCMYLKEKDDKKLFKNIEALKLSKEKYIRKGSSKRTQIFVRMLLALDESNYIPEQAVITAAPWIQKLEANPYTFPGAFEGLEVVPFEHLWEMVLGYAGKMKIKRRSTFLKSGTSG